jgi:hypothetical protein
MTEKIDELRWLLDSNDRRAVTITNLCGLRDTTLPGDSYRSHAPSGDVAYVILGPKEMIDAKRIESKVDGSVVYTFTLVPPKE